VAAEPAEPAKIAQKGAVDPVNQSFGITNANVNRQSFLPIF
jgi:hypothetical protein